VAVDRVASGPFAHVLGYPRATPRQLAARAAALRALGVTGVSLEGPVVLGGARVLGKGYASVVLAARWRRRDVALKVRRTDSPRRTMLAEARLLALANAAGAGPRLLARSRNALVMERAAGVTIGEWLSSPAARGARAVRAVVRRTLESCRALDIAGIDHGELSSPSRHVMVGGGHGITIVDFESASTSRRVSNVTSAAQALLVGASLSGPVRRACSLPGRGEAVDLLRAYKSSMSDASFAGLLGGMGL